ncbi:MAG TPA: gluconokinase [Gammaproteobacteria bacterium]|nr:gluconokinase [Gammaproteobacteria bacterium]
MIVVIMGVSGSGKTTVGALLAGRLNWAFADADDFHNAANIAKMHSGVPLDDADRKPWLAALARQIDEWMEGGVNGIVTCSALKRRYRDVIIGQRPGVRLVYLKGDKSVIARRMTARHGHFMPTALLDSQLDALEEPDPDEHAIVVPIDAPPSVLVERILSLLHYSPHPTLSLRERD